MKRDDFKEWEASRRLPFNGFTADRLREIGVDDKKIRKLTIAQADEILNSVETYEDEPQLKKYICRYCHAPIYRSEVAISDNTIICMKCAGIG